MTKSKFTKGQQLTETNATKIHVLPAEDPSNYPTESCPSVSLEMSQAYLDGKPERRGEQSRMRDHNAVLRATGDRRAAIRAYCAGNKWATENAKAVGNW